MQDEPKIKLSFLQVENTRVRCDRLYNTMLSAYKDSLLPLERLKAVILSMYIKNSNGPKTEREEHKKLHEFVQM